jgi:DNA-binding CsgD family transcriptional regulator
MQTIDNHAGCTARRLPGRSARGSAVPVAGVPVAGRSFVGRGAELALLRDLLAGLGAGIGGLLLVVGEQGIGKSSLLRVGLEAGSAGCQALWAAAGELERQIPLRLMEECLGAAVPEPVPQPGGTSTSTVGVFAGDAVLAGVERMLARVDRLCAVSPVVLVTEDLHWADEASVLVWSRLARAVGQVPLLLVGSYRPGTGREDLDRLHRGVLARHGNVVELGLLPDAEVAELVGGLVAGSPGQRLTELMGHAGGNPMYAHELADSLVRDGQVAVASGVAEMVAVTAPVRVPVSLDAAIGKRLAGLAEDTVRVLRWAAVLGAEFSVTDLEVVSGQSVGDLMEMIGTALRAGVLAEAGTRLEFRHGLIRQALYEGLPSAQRGAMHIEAARALATAGAAAGRVASQLAAAQQAAGPDGELASDWAASWLATAAPVLNYRAPQVAAELFRGVLAALADDDDRREILQANLATVSFLLLRSEQVEQIAGRLAATARDPVRAAEMAWLLAYSRMRTGCVTGADSVIEAALTRLGRTPATARLIALRAMILLILGKFDESAKASDEALVTAEKSGDRLAAGYAHHARSMVAMMHRNLQAGLDHTAQALAVIGGDLQASDLRVLVMANRIGLLSEMDRQQDAAAEGREALTLAEQAGTPRIATARAALADLYLTGGQWDDALAELEPAVGLPGPDYLPLLIHGTISLIAAHRDDGQTAEDHLGRIRDELLSSPAAPANLHFLQLAQAAVAERAGRPDEAIEVLAAALAPGAMPGRSLLLLPLVRLTLAAGDTATAANAAAAAREEAEREPLRRRLVIADQCTGLVAGDAAAVLAAAKYYQATGRVPDQAAALEDAAALMARQGDAAAARRALASALELYEELGAAWDVRRASARLREYGIRRTRAVSQRRPQTGWEALTPTETKVASLVAEGRSNPHIAAQLFLSRNTVQTHVSHILTKLGARSRADVIRVAMDQA